MEGCARPRVRSCATRAWNDVVAGAAHAARGTLMDRTDALVLLAAFRPSKSPDTARLSRARRRDRGRSRAGRSRHPVRRARCRATTFLVRAIAARARSFRRALRARHSPSGCRSMDMRGTARLRSRRSLPPSRRRCGTRDGGRPARPSRTTRRRRDCASWSGARMSSTLWAETLCSAVSMARSRARTSRRVELSGALRE